MARRVSTAAAGDRRRRARLIGFGVASWLLVAPAAQAQLPAVSVPKGVLRLEAEGLFDAFDERFHDGEREGYGADLSSPALGSDRIPALADIDARIDRITGTAGSRLVLGNLATDAHADISTAVLGASFGLSNRLTIFGRLPLTSNRVQSHSSFDPTGAAAGLVLDPSEQATFFNQFETALATLQSKLAAGAYSGTTRTLAEATLARGTSIHDDLLAIFGAPSLSAPFAPLASSATGAAIAGQVKNLQDTLSIRLGVNGFADSLALPTEPLTDGELADFVQLGLGYRPGQTQLSYRGDAEAGMAYTLVDNWDRGQGNGGFRTAVSALIRFPTGVRDRTDRLLDLGTGDGQTDVELGIVTDVGGGRWGARATATYVRQLPADIEQRVTSPRQPLAGLERLAVVRWNPGDVVMIGVHPFYRLVRTFAFQAGVDHWRRGTDEVSYASSAGGVPGVEASVLAIDSKASATSVSAGFTYASVGAQRPGGRGLPVEASWKFERVMSNGTGVVPAVQRVRAMLRLYFRLFKA